MELLLGDNRLDAVLSKLYAAWDDMLVARLKKRQWHHLKKHIERINSPLEWERVFSDSYSTMSEVFAESPLSDEECLYLVKEGQNLFLAGDASRLFFLSKFYERAGGSIIERFNFPDTPEEIRCISSFIAATMESVLETDETFLSCVEGSSHITASWMAPVALQLFNTRERSLIYVTNKRILIFGRFPNLPSSKLIKEFIKYAVYRILYHDIEQRIYLEGLDIIELRSISDIKSSKKEIIVSFYSEYLQFSSNMPSPSILAGAIPNLIAVTLQAIDKRQNIKSGGMKYIFKLTTSNPEEVASKFVESIQTIRLSIQPTSKSIRCHLCDAVFSYSLVSIQEGTVKCQNCLEEIIVGQST